MTIYLLWTLCPGFSYLHYLYLSILLNHNFTFSLIPFIFPCSPFLVHNRNWLIIFNTLNIFLIKCNQQHLPWFNMEKPEMMKNQSSEEHGFHGDRKLVQKHTRAVNSQTLVLCDWLGILEKRAFYVVPSPPLKHIS